MIKLKVNMRDSDTGATIREVQFFDEVTINLKFDSVASTFKLQMYFDPNNAVHAELATVSHIHECSLFYVHEKAGRYMNERGRFEFTTDELIITGFMLSQVFKDSAAPSFMEIGGYSKPGVLGDCDIPTEAYPLESVGLSFRQIVEKILPYFGQPSRGGFQFKIKSTRADSIFEEDDSETGISLSSIMSSADSDLGKSTAPESKNVLSYLRELALQKNITLSHDVLGNFIVNAPYTGNDFLFEIGTGSPKAINFIEMEMNFNGQPLHSQIEAVRQPDKDGGNMAYAMVTNPLVPVVFRPKVIVITSGDDNTAKDAARSEIGTELKSIPLKIVLDKPVANGRFIMPNNTIKVKNRSCYLYDPSKWFIEEVNYVKNSNTETCTITAVLPETYLNGVSPIKGETNKYRANIKNPFIDPHKNVPRV